MALAGFGDRFTRKDYIEVDEQRFDDFIINHDQTVFKMKDIAFYAGQDSADLVEEPWVNLARQAQETLEEDITYLAWLAKLNRTSTFMPRWWSLVKLHHKQKNS